MINSAHRTMIIPTLIITAMIMVTTLLAVPATSAKAEPGSVPAPLPGYTLAWADEFDGTALKTDDWYYRESEKAICSNSPDNVSVSGGSLKIALKREDRNGMPYTCGGVISKRWFGYGYYETRAELWGEQGFHSALWTTGLSDAMPDTPDYKGPNNRVNEIDGFEIDSHAPTRIQHHSHWFTPAHVGNQGGIYEGPDSSDGYHTYGFEWLPHEIRFYVDGVLARSQAYAGPHGLQSIWLTTLGYTAPVDESDLPGVTSWDYFRYFAPTDDGDRSTPDSVIVDNGGPGYAETGGWTGTGEAFGFQDRETRRATAPGATAAWTPKLRAAGSYEVSVWNPSFLKTGHTAARYTIEHAGGRTEVVLNQVTAGQRWVSLGAYTFTPGAGHGVTVAGDPAGQGTLRADAVRFTPTVVVDDGGPGYTETGSWAGSATLKGWHGTGTRYASASSSTARWTPELPAAGRYAVYAWTPRHAENATGARFTVNHAGGRAVVASDGVADRWTSLGTYAFAAGTAGWVELGKDTGVTGLLRADAVKFVPVPDGTVRPPTRVRGTVASTPATGDAAVTWTWRESAGPKPAGYHVYLDGQRVTWQPVRREEFRMDGFRPGQRHRLTVTAVDAAGRESAPATAAMVRTPADTTAPAAPIGLTGEAANEAAVLYWTQNTEVDLLGYHIYADGRRVTDKPVGHPADPDFTRLGFKIDKLANDVDHLLEVRAVDLSGHESAAATISVRPLPMTIIGVTDEGYTEQGTWTASSIAGWLRSKTRTSNVATATAEWRPTLAAGTYEVYAWVPRVAGNSTTAARFTVTHADGTTALEFDQTAGSGGWERLGRFDFAAGSDGFVSVANAAGRSYLRTNTVKFVPAG
ncbi:golvesin C-terminal-like domain-containing protein [Microlunatus parietis]|uniref:Beta-glucanase, GH16 family n=1 Tax=Microlunatus parietis TaxID=682979 RepID=A0A7Y9I5R0_9ACTN|nr:family 16 glycosylhydrolase [Microlunatus parietis]NYE70764.1 hypothetical protein [Microlunatus parietis]